MTLHRARWRAGLGYRLDQLSSEELLLGPTTRIAGSDLGQWDYLALPIKADPFEFETYPRVVLR